MINIEKIMELLPSGYEKACYEKKAIERKREIKNAKDLMKLCLIYLSQKCSLMEISEIARLMGIGKISDVAFMKRFAKCGEWFKWILNEISPKGIVSYEKPEGMGKYDFIALDASDIVEKGATKRVFRLHYAIDIFTMTSAEYKITTEKTGESLTNFTIKPNYLVIGDRAYASKTGIEYCLEKGGNFIFRIRNKAFKLYDENGKEINLLKELEKATETEAADISVYMENSKKELIELRICAIKKNAEEIEKSNKRLHRKERRKQLIISEETKKTHDYIFVITSLPSEIKAYEIMSVYRFRWQVELYFKRLKSIMDFGDLPKKKEEGITAWLNGKLIVAMLLEKLLSGVDFSPSVEKTK
jgi:hypothetical protein